MNAEDWYNDLYRSNYNLCLFIAFGCLQDSGCSVTPKDIIQNVFMRIWKHRDRLIGTTGMKAYIARSIKNECTDQIRRHLSKRLELPFADRHHDHECMLDYYNLVDLIEQALIMLPKRSRKAFILAKIDGLSYNEICEDMNVSLSSVKYYIHRAVVKIREHLIDNGINSVYDR